MEGVEAFLEGEWESLIKMFSNEDSDLLLHCNGNVEIPFSFFDSCESVGGFDASFLHQTNTHLSSCSQESSHSSSEIESSLFAFFARPDAADFTHKLDDQSMHLSDDSCKEVQLKRKCEEDDDSSHSAKKGPYREARIKKNARSKKAKNAKQTTISSDEEMNNTICISKEEEEEEEEIYESPEKAKAGKNPATDAQSLYARKRRERINERLKVLQNLVPNGTKVDISTMLEEAVHYVKFLQLQIKLLSSDDMWMYSPIAYNGMDIGHYQKIVPNF